MKRVLVTGGSKGIGQAIAIELGKEGYDVCIHYASDKAGAESTLSQVKESGGEGHIIQFDVRNREETRKTLSEELEEFGPFFGVVSNAGVAKDDSFPSMSDEDWDKVIDTNLNGFYNVVQPCVMPMIRSRKPGRIITISSVSGITGNRGQVNYSATKAGLIGATKSLALELGKRNITVNCVAPGIIDTGMVTEEQFDYAKPLIPLRRMGEPAEVAGLVSYLMSDKASYITRQVISINGGLV